MKVIIWKPFVLLLIVSSACNQDFDDPKWLVVRISIKQMAARHLSDFELVRSRLSYSFGREYVFSSEDDAGTVFVRIGLYPSAKIAENKAKNYFSQCSAVFIEGTHQDFIVGDKCWLH